MIKRIKNSQGLKFIAVGGFNTALDFIILFSLQFLGFNKIISNVFSTGVTFIISFFLNKNFTFESKLKDREEIERQIILFSVVTLFGLWAIQSVVISVTSPIIDSQIKNISLSLFIAKIIATIFSLNWNFILYKRVVFKK